MNFDNSEGTNLNKSNLVVTKVKMSPNKVFHLIIPHNTSFALKSE